MLTREVDKRTGRINVLNIFWWVEVLTIILVALFFVFMHLYNVYENKTRKISHGNIAFWGPIFGSPFVTQYTDQITPSYKVKTLPTGCLGWVHSNTLQGPVYLCKEKTILVAMAGTCTIVQSKFPLLIRARRVDIKIKPWRQLIKLPWQQRVKMPGDKLCITIGKYTPRFTPVVLEIFAKLNNPS